MKEEIGLEVAEYFEKVFENTHLKEAIAKPALTVDQLLDKYNDYRMLHKMFGDVEYLDTAESVLKELRGR